MATFGRVSTSYRTQAPSEPLAVRRFRLTRITALPLLKEPEALRYAVCLLPAAVVFVAAVALLHDLTLAPAAIVAYGIDKALWPGTVTGAHLAPDGTLQTDQNFTLDALEAEPPRRDGDGGFELTVTGRGQRRFRFEAEVTLGPFDRGDAEALYRKLSPA